MARKSRPYEIGLRERLMDASHAIGYIKAAAADSIEGFLLALRDFAEATKGMTKVAEAADKNRENLYRMLSEEGNPRLDSLWAVLHAMGLRLTVEPIRPIESAQNVGVNGTSINVGASLAEDGTKDFTLLDFGFGRSTGMSGSTALGSIGRTACSTSTFDYASTKGSGVPATDQPIVFSIIHSPHAAQSNASGLL